MNLPVRIVGAAPAEPVVCVDGSLGAPGLELSHWPGNRTPARLKAELSTGCALAFARLDDGERTRLAAGATAIVNNHFDTDGLCAVFATRHPQAALAREGALLDAAAAGDFFRVPSEEVLALDALVGRFSEPERSPIAAELAGLDDLGRWNLAEATLLEILPALLDGGLADFRPAWEPVIEATRADLDDLRGAEREEERPLDLTLWRAPRNARSSRDDRASSFDPGRHALFGSTGSDRALVLGSGPDGTTARLVVSTLSWFDLPRPALARPDLEALADRLNELEGVAATDECAWRAQPPTNASPELWFGTTGQASFAEHSPCLRPSSLAPETILDTLRAGLRTPTRA